MTNKTLDERRSFYADYNRARINQGLIREFPDTKEEFHKYLNSKYTNLEDFTKTNMLKILAEHVGFILPLDYYAERNHAWSERIELKTHHNDMTWWREIIHQDYLQGDKEKCLEVIELGLRYYRSIINNSKNKKEIRKELHNLLMNLINIRELHF
jgi:hypothetical protein